MTEQKYMQEFISRNWKYWLLALVIGVVLGVGTASKISSSYQGSVSFRVNHTSDETSSPAPYFTYDGFYSEQTAQLARNNFESWLTSPRAIYDIYSKVGLAHNLKASDNLTTYLKPKEDKLTNNVTVSYQSDSESHAKDLGMAVVTYAKDNYKVENITIESMDPLVMTIAPKKTLIAAAIAIAITFASFFITLLMHFFRSSK